MTHIKKVKFYDLQKRKYTGLPHLSKIYIPPAYTDVEDGLVIQTVRYWYFFDSKKNNTYIINNLLENKWIKFSDLKNFGKR